MKPSPLPSLLLALFLALAGVTAGCGRRDAHAGHHHAAHAHTAPHGGTLVELGDHAFNLELVRDAATGRITAYVLDGHASEFIRARTPAFEIVATVGGEKRPLPFRAIANPTTGETVGDSSQFEAQADWLRTTAAFDGVLTALEIRGMKFEQVAFRFPK